MGGREKVSNSGWTQTQTDMLLLFVLLLDHRQSDFHQDPPDGVFAFMLQLNLHSQHLLRFIPRWLFQMVMLEPFPVGGTIRNGCFEKKQQQQCSHPSTVVTRFQILSKNFD